MRLLATIEAPSLVRKIAPPQEWHHEIGLAGVQRSRVEAVDHVVAFDGRGRSRLAAKPLHDLVVAHELRKEDLERAAPLVSRWTASKSSAKRPVASFLFTRYRSPNTVPGADQSGGRLLNVAPRLRYSKGARARKRARHDDLDLQ
jgi:hypothetical protein